MVDQHSKPSSDLLVQLRRDQTEHRIALAAIKPDLEVAERRVAEARDVYQTVLTEVARSREARDHGMGMGFGQLSEGVSFENGRFYRSASDSNAGRILELEADWQAAEGAKTLADEELQRAMVAHTELNRQRSVHQSRLRAIDMCMGQEEARLERAAQLSETDRGLLQRIRARVLGATATAGEVTP